jgi:hypothetical protein
MKRPVLVLLLAGTLALAGCAQAGGSTTAPPVPSPSPSASSGAGCPAETPAEPVVLTEAQNGTAYCLRTGTHLEIYLQGTVADPWAPLACDGTVLRPEVSGKRALKAGVTAGFYVADHAGQAVVTSTRDQDRYEVTIRVV